MTINGELAIHGEILCIRAKFCIPSLKSVDAIVDLLSKAITTLFRALQIERI